MRPSDFDTTRLTEEPSRPVTPAALRAPTEVVAGPWGSALQRSEERNLRLINTSQDLIWEIAIDGLPEIIERIRAGECSIETVLEAPERLLNFRQLFVNPAVERVLGFTPEEAIARPFEAGLTPKSLRVVYQILGTQLALEIAGQPLGPIHAELEEIHRDGSIVILEALTQILRDDEGAAIGLAGTSRDITKRKAAEVALERHSRQQAAVAQLGQLAVTAPDLDHLMAQVSRTVANALGAQRCHVFEPLPGAATQFLVRAGAGWKDRPEGQIILQLEKQSLLEEALQSQNPVQFDDLNRDLRGEPHVFLEAHGGTTGLLARIGDAAMPFGVLGIFDPAPREFSQNDSHFLQASANLLAGAIRRQRSEQALRSSEEKFRSLVETTSEWIWEMNLERQCIYSNPRVASILGYTPEELRHLHVPDLFHPDTREDTTQLLARCVEAKTGWVGEIIRLRHKDGSYRYLESNATPILDHQGQVVGFRGSDRDVTESRQAQRRLAESENWFRTIFECEPECVKVLDRSGALLDMNPSGLRMIEADSLDELRGRPISMLLAPEYRALMAESVEAVFRGETRSLKFEIIGLKGTRRWMDSIQVPLPDSKGRTVAAVAVTRDFTAKQAAEEALRNSEQQLRESLQEKEILLREIHHRVKNNLQIVSSLLHFQARKLADPEAAEIIRDGQRRLHAIVLVHDQLYQAEHLSRVQFGQYVHKLANEVKRSQDGMAAHLDLVVDAQPISLPIETALPLGMVINELVTNALKHAYLEGDRGTIEVRLERAGRTLAASVADDGHGLPSTVNPAQPETFGLQLVQNLSRQVNGTVSFSSGDGGTLARLVLEL